MKTKITILIPCLNEEKTLGICIEKAKRFIAEQNLNAEILVVDNGSTDTSLIIAKKMGVRTIEVKEVGYGNALRAGIENANGDYIIMGDADDSYNFLEIQEFIEELENGYDLVIGNRYHHMEKGAMKWLHKYIGTPIMTKMINKKYGLNLNDVNCGMRGIRKNKILELNLKTKGMEFASEMLIKAKQANLKIKEIPINFYKDKRNRKSHLRTIRDGIRHFKIIKEINC